MVDCWIKVVVVVVLAGGPRWRQRRGGENPCAVAQRSTASSKAINEEEKVMKNLPLECCEVGWLCDGFRVLMFVSFRVST
jgi:hypothetical protein